MTEHQFQCTVPTLGYRLGLETTPFHVLQEWAAIQEIPASPNRSRAYQASESPAPITVGHTPSANRPRPASSWPVTTNRTGARPIWLGQPGRPAFGWWHEPVDGRARAGVLLCAPLGFDYLQSHRALRLLADELAGEGFCVIRFDYDGTGDSTGGSSAERLANWMATARSALAMLRRHGLTDVSLVGMRMGAIFAAMVANHDRGIDQLVLWDPCTDGRSYLAEQRATSRLTGGGLPGPEGSLEGPGVVYSAATVRDIERMNLAQCTMPVSRRVLILTRPDRPPNPSLHELAFASETLTRDMAAGQHELMDLVPPLQHLPLEAIRRIVSWMSDGVRSFWRAVSAPDPGGTTVVDWDPLGRAILETPMAVPPVGLFGMLTEPADMSGSAHRPLVLFANAGNHHHVGLGRVWVDLARRWATFGIRSLRIDFSGLGDSPFRENGVPQWTCLKPESFDDILDVTHWACPDDPSNVVLVGLCSSGNQAIESALALGARGVIAINPAITFMPPERENGKPLDPRRRIVLPKDDIVPTFREGGRFGWLRERFPDLAWRARVLLSPKRRSGLWLTELVQKGTDTFLICGDTEIRPIRQGLGAARLRQLHRSALFRLEHLHGLDHALPVASQRALVMQMLSDHVLSRYQTQAPILSSAGPFPDPEQSPSVGTPVAVSAQVAEPSA